MTQISVLPGDKIPLNSSYSILGPGIRVCHEETSIITAVNCGILRERKKDELNEKLDQNAIWVDCHNLRYSPIIGDCVIGAVIQKIGSEGWKLEFGCAELANVSSLSFEGATKRNRPNVKIGDLIYGRLIQIVEPEITCISDDRRAKTFSVLPSGGWLIRSTPSHVRKLLTPECKLFKILGEKVPFEVTCGMNGWIWIKAKGLRETMFVTKAIENSRHLQNDQMRDMVMRLEKEKANSF